MSLFNFFVCFCSFLGDNTIDQFDIIILDILKVIPEVRIAIPIVMGANIGTSVTTILVSLTHMVSYVSKLFNLI